MRRDHADRLCRTSTLGAVAALAMLAAPARASDGPPPAEPKDQCFWSRSISGFTAPDDHTVYLRVGTRQVYRLDMMGRCPELDWTHAIALKSRGSSFICRGLGTYVVVPRSTFGSPERCPVRSLRKLTPQEIAALEPRQRP